MLDKDNTVQVASDDQFRKVSQLFNQFYDLELIFNHDKPMTERDIEKLHRKFKSPKKLGLLLGDSAGKKGQALIKDAKMFKMNDLSFYVDHINKMLFKTKGDQWLYERYQAFRRQ